MCANRTELLSNYTNYRMEISSSNRYRKKVMIKKIMTLEIVMKTKIITMKERIKSITRKMKKEGMMMKGI
jgi:hypothetical protein